MNLYLALLNYGKNATFTTVWEQKHIKAERNGGESVAESNFISWVAGIEGVNIINIANTTNSGNSTDSNNPTKLLNSKLLKLNNFLFLILFLILI